MDAATTLTVVPGGSTTLTVTLESADPGRFAGLILLGTNDLDEAPFEIGVTGLVRAVVPEADGKAIVVDDELDPTGKTSFELDGGGFRYIRRDTRYVDNDVLVVAATGLGGVVDHQRC